MTRNQIEYAKLKETARANLAQELLTSQRDLATRELGSSTLAEQRRSNEARELLQRQQNQISQGNLDEMSRYHAVTAAETKRNNLALSTLKGNELLEAARSNLAREAETLRSNLAREALTQAQQDEVARSNLANEQIRRAANYVAKYGIDVNATTAANQLAELVRNHRAIEEIQQQNADTAHINARTAQFDATTRRLDTVTGAVRGFLNLAETARTNRANEAVRRSQAAASQQQADAATQRANIEKQYAAQGWISSITGGVKNIAGSIRDIGSAGSSAVDALDKILNFGGN